MSWAENYASIEDIRSERMNIFYLAHDPAAAAAAHCDRHVVKMVLETAQLLSTAWHEAAPDHVSTDLGSTDPHYELSDVELQKAAGLKFGVTYYLDNQRIYAPTHERHPSAEWVRESRANYDWLWALGQELLSEYEFRYGRAHATTAVLRTLEFAPPDLPDAPRSEPPPAMPDDRVVLDADGYVDAVASYRNYYRVDKTALLRYTRREPPAWCADLAFHRRLRTERWAAPAA